MESVNGQVVGATNDWVASVDDDDYTAGPYASIGEALEMAPADLDLEIGERFFIGRRKPYKPLVDGQELINLVGELTFSEVGDAADQFLVRLSDEVADELAAEVQIVFDAWLKRHRLEPNFWQVHSVQGCTYGGADEGAYMEGS